MHDPSIMAMLAMHRSQCLKTTYHLCHRPCPRYASTINYEYTHGVTLLQSQAPSPGRESDPPPPLPRHTHLHTEAHIMFLFVLKQTPTSIM